MLKQITKEHPDLYEKINNICSISDNDIERVADDSAEVIYLNLIFVEPRRT